MKYVKITFTKDDLFRLKIRRAIYKFILENPGLHFRELGRRLNIPRSTINYHLNCLKKQGLIITKKDYKYNRYFISEDMGEREKKILNIIRVETTRDVLLYIWIMVSASRIEIAKELDKHPTTVEFHLKRLLKCGIIEPAPTADGIIYTSLKNIPIIKRKKSKNEVFYRLKEPEIEKLLIMYYEKGQYHDIIAEAILTFVEELTPLNRPVKGILTAKERGELIEEIIFDIFPHPYYA